MLPVSIFYFLIEGASELTELLLLLLVLEGERSRGRGYTREG